MSSPLGTACVAGFGGGTNGISLYTPSNQFTYQLSTTSANTADSVTLGWGAAYSGPSGSYTGSLKAQLWAVTQSYSGGAIYGYILGDFPPNFSGIGAHSSSQINGGNHSINTITSSTVDVNPPPGQYCLVIVLSQYTPGSCSPNPNGYCSVDWLQFNPAVIFK